MKKERIIMRLVILIIVLGATIRAYEYEKDMNETADRVTEKMEEDREKANEIIEVYKTLRK